jgi:hypothetical protein
MWTIVNNAAFFLSPEQFRAYYSALQKYSFPLAFFLFCCITTWIINGFLFGFHVTDIDKIVQIGEVK